MKITFLFGAGAEGAGQIGMPFGNEFKKDMILAENVASFIKSINNSTKPILTIREGTNIAHNSSGILYQTLVEMQETDPYALDKLFDNDADKNTARDYLDYKLGSRKFEDVTKSKLKDDFRKLYKNFYKEIAKGTKSAQIDAFLENAGIYSYLDGLFGYLRKPERYPKECARVVKMYYSALLSMLKALCRVNNPAMTDAEVVQSIETLNRDNLSSFILKTEDEIIKRINEAANDESGNIPYYVRIKDIVTHEDVACFAINLNYTSFAQKMIGLDDDHMAYLHGRLCLFEELVSKKIGQLSQLDSTATVFPYLLVQSGVKPIISPSQILEFGKARQWVNDSDLVIVIGYGVNADDEHISSYLRWRISNNKQIKCFIHKKHGSNEYEAEKLRIERQLGSSAFLTFDSTDEFSDYLTKCIDSHKQEDNQ